MASMIRSPRFVSTGESATKEVINDAGEELGKIEEFVMDVDNGRIAYAVLSFGGFLGVGEKWFAIPWQALKPSHDGKKFILNTDKETLKRASGFTKGDWPKYGDVEWASGIHTYYGYRPYWLD